MVIKKNDEVGGGGKALLFILSSWGKKKVIHSPPSVFSLYCSASGQQPLFLRGEPRTFLRSSSAKRLPHEREKLCQQPHVVCNHTVIIDSFLCMRSCAVETRHRWPAPQGEEKKHTEFCHRQSGKCLLVCLFFLIKEFNPNCQLKGIAETVC